MKKVSKNFDLDKERLDTLKLFLSKPNLWISSINKSSVVSFIHGFEAGAKNCFFTNQIKQYMEMEFEIFGSNQGWPNQISIYAKKNGLEWDDAFFKISIKILE